MLGLWRVRQLLNRPRARRALRAAEAAVARFPTVRTRRPHGLSAPLVISLTSYPKRYPTLVATLKSILDQDMVADRTILWIGHDDLDDLPAEVRALEAHGLEIIGCDDLRSYKKLIPALETLPPVYLVTADDDVYYPPDWLGTLVDALPDARTVTSGRAHLVFLEADGTARPYARWELGTRRREGHGAGTRLFPTGVGGVLYPPGAFDPQVTDRAAFTELCPNGDDIWFFWMARLAGTSHIGATRPCPLVPWAATQDVALYHDNLVTGGNDRQIRAMEARFGSVP